MVGIGFPELLIIAVVIVIPLVVIAVFALRTAKSGDRRE